MIAKTVEYICSELNLDTLAEIGDVARLETSKVPEGDMDKNVIVTLVNIEEEKTLKNGSAYVQNGDVLNKRNPTVFLNLYLLFSCAHNEYAQALKRISKVVLFFQRKNVFTPENVGANLVFPTEVGVEKIILDLFTLNFEQINHLWGVLGGKYMPSVLYKLRIVAIQNAKLDETATVKEIQADANLK